MGANLVRDSSGNLFGDTTAGGSANAGVVFKVTAAGTESVLLDFNNTSGGGHPYDGLAEDKSGNLYGITLEGGANQCGAQGACGVLFELSPAGKETVLHSFGGTNDGYEANGGVVLVGGSVYGTTEFGGTSSCGTVFKYTP